MKNVVKRFTLISPLKSKGFLRDNIIEMISIREPCVKDILGIDFSKNTVEGMVTLTSRLTGISEQDICEMSLVDYQKISMEITKMMNFGSQK